MAISQQTNRSPTKSLAGDASHKSRARKSRSMPVSPLALLAGLIILIGAPRPIMSSVSERKESSSPSPLQGKELSSKLSEKDYANVALVRAAIYSRLPLTTLDVSDHNDLIEFLRNLPTVAAPWEDPPLNWDNLGKFLNAYKWIGGVGLAVSFFTLGLSITNLVLLLQGRPHHRPSQP